MPQSRRVTLKQIAEAAGVSQSTASRALAGSSAIASETVARVEAAADTLQYAPRRTARERGGDRKGVVGVVVAALHNAFYPFLVDRLHDELDALGYDMILIIDELSNSSSSRKIQGLIDTALDGVIFTTASIGSPAVDLLVARRVPVVLAIRSNRKGNASVVESDNEMSGQEAAEHLISLGHTRLGAVLGPHDTSTAVGRFDGFREAVSSAGLSVDPSLVVWSNFTHESGYSGLVRLMRHEQPPTAVFCGNDVIAIGALDASKKLGLSVPDDVSIIGVDDIPMASWSMISLTTIRQDIMEIGAKAAHRLASQIEASGDMSPTHDILPTSVVRRNTTATFS